MNKRHDADMTHLLACLKLYTSMVPMHERDAATYRKDPEHHPFISDSAKYADLARQRAAAYYSLLCEAVQDAGGPVWVDGGLVWVGERGTP